MRFTATRQERTFVDSDGVTIHYYVWKAGSAAGVVQIAHGLGDHALRYENLAQALVEAGFTVYADDHRGHGQTGLEQAAGDVSKLGQLGKGGIRAAIRSVHELTDIIHAENPGLPLALIGHSWGSLFAQVLVNQDSSDYAAVVLTGTAYRTLQHMNGGDLAKRHNVPGGNGYEWLSRNQDIGKAFEKDPLTFKANAVKLFGLLENTHLLGKPGKHLASDIPVLIQIGSEDTLGGPKSAELLANAYLKRSHLSDVQLIVYTGARHEVFNETNKDEVIGDTIGWLKERLAVGEPSAR